MSGSVTKSKRKGMIMLGIDINRRTNKNKKLRKKLRRNIIEEITVL